jgi:hypothetical protein
MIRRRMTVKRIDPWSVLKLGLVINIATAAILVLTGVIVWSVIRRLQIIERICEQGQNILGFESCVVEGSTILRNGFMMAGLGVVVFTGVMVFLAFLYNLIADLTGGIQVTMLDQSGDLQSARSATGGVQVAPELQTTGRGRPPVRTRSSAAEAEPELRQEGATKERVVAASRKAAEVSERATERIKDAAQKASTAIGEAGRKASESLANATATEATNRANQAEADTQSLDAVTSPRTSGRSSDGSSRSSSRTSSGQSSSGRPAGDQRTTRSRSTSGTSTKPKSGRGDEDIFGGHHPRGRDDD